MRKELKKDHGHLSIKARLADEVARGLYPSLTKDLLWIKAQNEGFKILHYDVSLMNRPISKLDALKVLIKLDPDMYELFIVFDMIPKKYAEILS